MKKKIKIVATTAIALSMLTGCENAVTSGNTNAVNADPGQKAAEIDVNDSGRLEGEVSAENEYVPVKKLNTEDDMELSGVVPEEETVIIGEIPAPEDECEEVVIKGDFPIVDDDGLVITDPITGEDTQEEEEILAGRMLPGDRE